MDTPRLLSCCKRKTIAALLLKKLEVHKAHARMRYPVTVYQVAAVVNLKEMV